MANEATSVCDTQLFCPECDYNLTGLNSATCPECGQAFVVARARYRPVRGLLAWLIWSAYAAAGVVMVGIPLLMTRCTH